MILLLLILAQVPVPRPMSQGPSADGGVPWAVQMSYVPTHAVTLASTTISNLPASQPVTGTFWQATQPVSGTLTCNAGSGTQAVSLASVPSHAVTLASTTITGSVATTGTYWQATQPVSIASMPSTPVTGTFFQATQPVSGSVSVGNFPATQPISGSVSVVPLGVRVLCILTTTATTSTQITGCEVSGATSIYITDIDIQGGVATGATAPAILQSGTGATCASPVVLKRCFHPATDGCIDNRTTAIIANAGHGLCLLDATAGTKTVTIGGYRL